MKIKNDYVTKQDIKKLRDEMKRDLRSLSNDNSSLKEEFKSLKSDIVDMQDKLMGEFKKMGEDNEIITGKHRIMRDGLEDHEIRIIKLETVSTASI